MSFFGAPLTSRQVAIILAVVEEHVRTAEPVGSKVVREQYDVDASTATIRNEMVDLEHAGYLAQPHTSAGRIPSEAAYRLYVNHLRRRGFPEPRGLPWLQSEYRRIGTAPHELLRATSRLLARATSHPAVVTQPPVSEPQLVSVNLQLVSADTVLLVYRTSAGAEHSHLLDCGVPVTPDLVAAVAQALQRIYVGKRLAALGAAALPDVQSLVRGQAVPHALLAAIRQAVAADDDSAVYVDGTSYILDEPEFEERGRLRQFMRTLDEDASLRQVMREATETTEVIVTIGSENRLPGMSGCSLVASSYLVQGGRGAVGVLGPTRMDYGQAIAIVEYAARRLSETLSPAAEPES